MASYSSIKTIKQTFLVIIRVLVFFILFSFLGILVVICVVIFIDLFSFKKIFLDKDGFTTLDFVGGSNSAFGSNVGSTSGFGSGFGSGSGFGFGSGSGSGSWSNTTILQFIQFQKTKNPLLIFDMDIIQQKATENEAIELLKTGMWPWSPVVQQIYKDTIVRDTNRQINPKDSMEKDRSIYCEAIIKDMLAFKAPEGQFLLYGVLVKNRNSNAAEDSGKGTYGEESGLISQNKDLIRCDGVKGMQRISSYGYDGITGVRVKNIENLNYIDLPEIIPGFSFLSSPCNPCDALSDDPLKKYRCPFAINKSNGNGGYYTGVKTVSDIWRMLWGFADYFTSSSVQIPSTFAAFRINS
jgi:hypothetical protein